jgi:hypothetical protein
VLFKALKEVEQYTSRHSKILCDDGDAEVNDQQTQQCMRGRQLWYTEGGKFAMGSDLQPNDIICIVHGADNPVALSPGPLSRYTVKGSRYLQGWMDPWSSGKVKWAENEGDEFLLV